MTFPLSQFLQFSRALGDAAIAQQQDIRQAFRQYANIASAYAQTNNKTWPFVTIPLFQSYGEHTLTQSGTELFNMFMRVEHKNREPYVNYTTANHEAWVKEGHMARYGNLDRLNEVGFHPYISNSLNGTGFLPDVDRDYYFCAWHMVSMMKDIWLAIGKHAQCFCTLSLTPVCFFHVSFFLAVTSSNLLRSPQLEYRKLPSL